MMKLPPLKALYYFSVAAKHLSFVKAAHELNVTEGAVSRQMKLLAEYYEKPLFMKQGRGVTLTREGEKLLAVTQPALNSISQVSAEILTQKHTLTVSVTTSFAIRWLLPKLVEFEQRYPQYLVQMQASSSEAALLGKMFDVQIDYYLKPQLVPINNSGKLLDEWLLPVCAPHYLTRRSLRAGEVIDVNNLSDCKLILNEITGRDWRLWGEMLNIDGLAIASALKFEQDDAAIQAAVAGHGIALANMAYVQNELALGSLVVATNQAPVLVGAHYLTIAKHKKTEAGVEKFTQWLIEKAAI